MFVDPRILMSQDEARKESCGAHLQIKHFEGSVSDQA
jgi:hypothetical protein